MRMRLAIMVLALVAGGGHLALADSPHSFTIVNIEYEGTKIWLPSTLVVHKGDTVKLKLINNVPSDPNQHGFAIAAFKVAEVVNRGEPKEVTFTADQAGIFPITCQLHPAHVGGQVVVLDEKK